MDEKFARHGGDFVLKFDDIVDALKGIYTDAGGEASAVANITTVGGMLDKVDEIVESGGGGSGDITVKSVLMDNDFTIMPEYPSMGFLESDMPSFFTSSTVPENVIITFNGTEYECEVHSDAIIPYYGATITDFESMPPTIDFSSYPFALAGTSEATYVFAESAMTECHVKVEEVIEYPSNNAEKIIIESGTLVLDTGEDYVAELTNGSEVDKNCFIEIDGQIYPFFYKDDNGYLFFTWGYVDSGTWLNTEGLGGSFTIYRYEYPQDIKWKMGTLGAMTTSGVVYYVSTGSAIADENKNATVSWVQHDPAHRFAENDVVIIRAEPGTGNNRVKFTADASSTGCTVTTLYSSVVNNTYAGSAWRIVQLTNVTDECSIRQAIAATNVMN